MPFLIKKILFTYKIKKYTYRTINPFVFAEFFFALNEAIHFDHLSKYMLQF